MIILAIDTTSDTASLAVRRDGATVCEETMHSTEGHGHRIFPMLETVLAKAGIALRQVDCFATAAGPGSFTGIRVCVATAKGLAEATGKRVSGVSNLRAMASFGSAPLRNPILEARPGHIYTGLYNAELKLVADEVLIAIEKWNPPTEAERITVDKPLAAIIALCAEIDGPERWVDPVALDANYVTAWQPKYT